MENLIRDSRTLVELTNTEYRRPLYNQIDWTWRLIGIRGARGVGKTTLMVQHLLSHDPQQEKSIYLSLDDLYFTANSLRDTVRELRAQGYRNFYLDEVHKYPTWARELKNIYDLLPDLKIVFTGSSVIQLLRKDVDLSRRVIPYDLYGLTFREYLILLGEAELTPLKLDAVLANDDLVYQQLAEVDDLGAKFSSYLRFGYYPYFLESKNAYAKRLKNTVNLVLETDLVAAEGGQVRQVRKLSQLLQMIAEIPPFKPNVSELAGRIELDRHTLSRYLKHLAEARVINTFAAAGTGMPSLQKPEKIYLENTNLAYVLGKREPAIGTIREMFMQNQLSQQHELSIPKKGDFLVDEEFTFEVGGPNKKWRQIKNEESNYLIIDGIRRGRGREIPLYLFGLLA